MIEPIHSGAIEAVLVEAVACHLCDDAAQLLANAESEGKLRDRRIALESEEGKAIARATRAPMPPIVLINGEFFMQMAKLEADGGLAKAGVTIVPVVMNSSSQVAAELQRYGIRTPYLVDPNGSVSNLYKTLGTGHHANLPGHNFILVGSDGTMKWRGDYPGMWVDPAELTSAVQAQLR